LELAKETIKNKEPIWGIRSKYHNKYQ
jgi:hypothetical protein